MKRNDNQNAFRLSDIENSDDSVKDQNYDVELDKSDTDSDSEIRDEQTQQKPSTSKKRKREVHYNKTREDLSLENISVKVKKYIEYFKTYNKNGVKWAKCILCESNKFKTADIKMKNANTTGLKYHMRKYHVKEFHIFFGDTAKPTPLPLQKKQKTLTEMFQPVTPIPVSLILHFSKE